MRFSKENASEYGRLGGLKSAERRNAPKFHERDKVKIKLFNAIYYGKVICYLGEKYYIISESNAVYKWIVEEKFLLSIDE